MDAMVSRIGHWLPVATHVRGVANALMRNPSLHLAQWLDRQPHDAKPGANAEAAMEEQVASN
ncbi:hypothetical protein C7413_11977 [Paraburkholderia silvatlantica]|nr:hypothetical protein C7411_12077 [Paraburkholderia silvatlantica]PXW34293.1 hypothetical protein C7413_11977 [Paraburkholderia silvatlantica]TDQ85188.1 hypothetical protein C7412_12077 [Paraburkholderia silvatlantica]